MSHDKLSDFVETTATEFGMPGVAVGVWANGQETYACHGVTSVDNPLPVDHDTMFLLGSITKTFTATMLMGLVADGRVELDAPVRRYVPELVLADERATAEVTVFNLLNHTSGLGWDLLVDTGEGDDALAAFVPLLAKLELIAPAGARASYSQAGYSVLNRKVESWHAPLSPSTNDLRLVSEIVGRRRSDLGERDVPAGSPVGRSAVVGWRDDEPDRAKLPDLRAFHTAPN